jgi:hypothetical protein
MARRRRRFGAGSIPAASAPIRTGATCCRPSEQGVRMLTVIPSAPSAGQRGRGFRLPFVGSSTTPGAWPTTRPVWAGTPATAATSSTGSETCFPREPQ